MQSPTGLMLLGFDPHFFPASEAADVFTAGRQREVAQELTRRLAGTFGRDARGWRPVYGGR